MQLAGLRGLIIDPARVDTLRDAATVAARTADGALTREPSRAVYRYHQVFTAEGRVWTRKLLLAAVKLAPWADGDVRPVEVVAAATRDAELASLRATGLQRQPLLAGFRDAAGEVDRLLRRAESERPLLEHATPDGTLHRVWRERRNEVLGSLRTLFAPKKLTLLEGHARYDALLAYSAERAAVGSYAASNYALAALVPLDEPSLHAVPLRPRHQIVRGPLVPADVLAAARRYFLVERVPGAARDPARLTAAVADTLMHQPRFALAFAGDPDGYQLTLSPDVSPVAEGVTAPRALQRLDAIVLDALLLPRCAPGALAEGTLDLAAALAALDAGASAVVVTRPPTFEQVLHVADAGGALPAGSVAVAPPVAAGLVLHALDPDEDLV